VSHVIGNGDVSLEHSLPSVNSERRAPQQPKYLPREILILVMLVILSDSVFPSTTG
jgi:hypothetical protein